MTEQPNYQENPPSIEVFGRSYTKNHATPGGSGIFYHHAGDTHGVKLIPYISALGQFGKAKVDATLEAHIAQFAQSLNPLQIIGADDTTEITLPNKQGGLAMLVRYGGKTARNNYQLNNEDKLTLCHNVASALTVLHQNNIMHGDISPENIVYHQTNQGIQAAITDFGEARRIGIDLDFPGGTNSYADPERAYGNTGYTNDVYSFSIISENLLQEYLAQQSCFGFGTLLKNELTAAKGSSRTRPSMNNLYILLRDALSAEKALQRDAA